MSARYVPTPSTDVLEHSWTDPLLRVERALRALPATEADAADASFDRRDFMIVGRLVDDDRPDIVIYKHLRTQRHLNVDPSGQTYEFRPPMHRSTNYGTYRPHRSLRHAIAELDLALLAPRHRGAPAAAGHASGSPSAA